MLQSRISLHQRGFQTPSIRFIGDQLSESDQLTLRIADAADHTVGEKLGAILLAMPSHVGSTALLCCDAHLGVAQDGGSVSRSEDDGNVLTDPLFRRVPEEMLDTSVPGSDDPVHIDEE